MGDTAAIDLNSKRTVDLKETATDLKSYRENVLNGLRIFDDEPDYMSHNFYFDLYANQLYNLIKEGLPDTPFAICLDGGWGEGKTSLLKRVYNGLREEKDAKFKVLWFNAWQYERLDPVLALLQKIANEYEGREAKKLNEIIKGLGLVFLDVVSRKTIGLNLEEIKGRFESSVKEIQAIHETLENLIGVGTKLIVFVDDLDRCSIENTINILESIKLVFSAKNTKFVVGADMKMLETAWALKQGHLVESPNKGREHLEKIFQLKLSLPPKAFILSSEFDTGGGGGSDDKPELVKPEDANPLIKSYVDSLAPKLPEELRSFIARSFPPNPRKIKRAMSLAYFIGKNLHEFEDKEFMDTFPYVLFWAVAVTYFPELATLVKYSPRDLYVIFDVLKTYPNISSLRSELGDGRNLRQDLLTNSPWLIKFAQSVASDRLMYRFLKASQEFFDLMSGEESKEKYINYVIEKAGLIS